jgi:hypothetical protein
MARELLHSNAGVHQIDPEWCRGRRYGFMAAKGSLRDVSLLFQDLRVNMMDFREGCPDKSASIVTSLSCVEW